MGRYILLTKGGAVPYTLQRINRTIHTPASEECKSIVAILVGGRASVVKVTTSIIGEVARALIYIAHLIQNRSGQLVYTALRKLNEAHAGALANFLFNYS